MDARGRELGVAKRAGEGLRHRRCSTPSPGSSFAFASDLSPWERCVEQASRSRGGDARGLAKKRERGRRSAAILSRREGSLAAPAPVACRAEGAVTSSAGLRSGSGVIRQSLSRPGPRAAARLLRPCGAWLTRERRCATGVRAGCCHLHSLDPRPRNMRRAKPRVRRPRRCRRLPQPGTAPAPHSRSADASHDGQGCGE